jgi:hypothetical protein
MGRAYSPQSDAWIHFPARWAGLVWERAVGPEERQRSKPVSLLLPALTMGTWIHGGGSGCLKLRFFQASLRELFGKSCLPSRRPICIDDRLHGGIFFIVLVQFRAGCFEFDFHVRDKFFVGGVGILIEHLVRIFF